MLLVICNYTKDNFLWELKKINFKFHGNRENTGKIVMRKMELHVNWENSLNSDFIFYKSIIVYYKNKQL